jgi:putative transcriptional regulator
VIKIYLSTILGEYRITQAELARKTKIRPTTICAIYNETIDRINLEHLSKICEALHCEVEDLLQYIPDDEYYKNKARPIKKARKKK